MAAREKARCQGVGTSSLFLLLVTVAGFGGAMFKFHETPVQNLGTFD